jgi:hypothetical protein
MKYLCFLRHSEALRAGTPPAALMQAIGEFVEQGHKDGTLVDTGGLLPSQAGFRVRVERGAIEVIDGPFSESKEVIGGWAILASDSRQQVLRVAREFMDLHRRHWPGFEGECEVRPMFEPGQGP